MEQQGNGALSSVLWVDTQYLPLDPTWRYDDSVSLPDGGAVCQETQLTPTEGSWTVRNYPQDGGNRRRQKSGNAQCRTNNRTR
jgi:hypothetical protein